MARGDNGINGLDRACKAHDIAYGNDSTTEGRYKADKILQDESMKRVFSKGASLSERTHALAVSAAMGAKRKFTKVGKGLKTKSRKTTKNGEKISFTNLVKQAKIAIKKSKPQDINSAISVAVKSIKIAKKGKQIRKPRSIKLPTISGGVLPLVPIIASLGALGSVIGSASNIWKTINQVKDAQKEFEESKRHNRVLEAIAIGNKVGNGFYLQPNTSGNGFYLAPYQKNY